MRRVDAGGHLRSDLYDDGGRHGALAIMREERHEDSVHQR